MTLPAESRVALRPITPTDHDTIFGWITTPGTGDRWRYHGRLPERDEFVGSLWDGVHEQLIVEATGDGTPLAMVTAYNADHRSASCSLAVVRAPSAERHPLTMVGVGLFLHHLFAEWPFAQIHLEIYEYNLPVLGSLIGRVGVVDGRLRDDLWWDGRFHDLLLIRIERATWETSFGPLVEARLARAERTREMASC